MAEFGDGPFFRSVAVRAGSTEEADVPVLRLAAGGAVVFEKGVSPRELPRKDRTLGRGSGRREMQDGQRSRGKSDDDTREPKNELGHLSHLNPK